MQEFYILFCESNFNPGAVDEDFDDEFLAAKQNGFSTLIFSYEDLVNEDGHCLATKRIMPAEELCMVLYRGWMLTPQQYGILYDDLLSKNYQLVNTVEEYRNCHYLPDSLTFIGSKTPLTIFEKSEDEGSMDRLIQKAGVFGKHPVILKDYVKSEKHDWYTACYVKDASDTSALKRSVEQLVKLRGKYLNEGIVMRALFLITRELQGDLACGFYKFKNIIRKKKALKRYKSVQGFFG